MSFLPEPVNDSTGWLTSRQVTRAQRDQAKAELTVFGHFLRTRTEAEVDRLDSQAVADASRAGLEVELELLDYGMARAGQSAAKVELVARHVERLSAINNRRISRRFGG